MSDGQAPGLSIGQIYLSRALLEHRPDALQLSVGTPLGEVALQVSGRISVNDQDSEGIIIAEVKTARDDELYRFHVEMIGFVKQDVPGKGLSIKEYLTKNGMFLMYPFMREAVADLTQRGRFGVIWLRPLNAQMEFEDVTQKEAQRKEEPPE